MSARSRIDIEHRTSRVNRPRNSRSRHHGLISPLETGFTPYYADPLDFSVRPSNYDIPANMIIPPSSIGHSSPRSLGRKRPKQRHGSISPDPPIIANSNELEMLENETTNERFSRWRSACYDRTFIRHSVDDPRKFVIIPKIFRYVQLSGIPYSAGSYERVIAPLERKTTSLPGPHGLLGHKVHGISQASLAYSFLAEELSMFPFRRLADVEYAIKVEKRRGLNLGVLSSYFKLVGISRDTEIALGIFHGGSPQALERSQYRARRRLHNCMRELEESSNREYALITLKYAIQSDPNSAHLLNDLSCSTKCMNTHGTSCIPTCRTLPGPRVRCSGHELTQYENTTTRNFEFMENIAYRAHFNAYEKNRFALLASVLARK